MRIAIYSRSCQNHHQGFTKGCQGNEEAQTLIGGCRSLEESGMGGGTPAVPPHLMPQKKSSSGQLPSQSPRSSFSQEEVGWGLGKRV